MKHVVLESADFDFTPYSNRGDSGLLLLGLHRPTGRQYIVKHACPECACNEFMYYTLGTFLGDRIPRTNLIHISPGDNRPYQSRYLVGSLMLKNAKKFVLADTKNESQIVNQWVVSEAITEMLSDQDGSEYVIGNDGELYRIDTAAAFNGNRALVNSIHRKFEIEGNEDYAEDLMVNLLRSWHRVGSSHFQNQLSIINRMTGKDCEAIYMALFCVSKH